MILIAPNDIHLLQIAPGAEYERIVLHFNLNLIQRAFRDLSPNLADLAFRRGYPSFRRPCAGNTV